jgi:hypothetical protein
MENIEIAVRIHLDRLRVDRADDGFIAGSADEPYLWFIVAKVDGSTISETTPETSTVAVHAPSAAPGNLGAASEGVQAGKSIPIPNSVGTFETTLRGTTLRIGLTRFATFVVAIAALEHDESRTQDIIALHHRVIEESKRGLERELREIIQEALAGDIPSAADVRKRLEAQLSEDTLKAIIDDFGGDLIGQPVNLLNQDVFVGHNIDTVLSFPDVLASSMDGTPIEARLRRGKVEDHRASYHVSGSVKRTDIHEPPTLGLVRLDDKRLRLCGRSTGKRVWVHERSTAGKWGFNTALGATALSSGVALAASADGSRMYAVGRGLSHKMRIKLPGSGDTWGKLPDRKFSTGAGVACSADGRLVFVMATGEDGKVYATVNFNSGNGWEGEWFPIGITSVASPALACSADGRKLFLLTLGEDRKIYESIFDVGLAKLTPKITLPLDSQRFKSAPACACSDDGKRLWFAAVGEDGLMRVSKPKLEEGGTSIWTELGELVSAPALACSPDGQKIHIAAIDKALRLRHRYSTDGGASWPKRDGQNWEVLEENAAWF